MNSEQFQMLSLKHITQTWKWKGGYYKMTCNKL
jgi:hypothetical protein